MKKLVILLTLCSVFGFAQGTDPAAPSDAGQPAATNNADRQYGEPRQADNDSNYGWIGLIGLAGLAGLRRRRGPVDNVRTLDRDREVVRDVNDIRRAG